jgi:hypothetical protein
MSTCRILINLEETKQILSKHFKLEKDKLKIFNHGNLFTDYLEMYQIENNSYLFQFDKASK